MFKSELKLKLKYIMSMFMVFYFMIVTVASASIFSTVKAWMGGEVLATIATVVTLLFSSIFGILFVKVANTMAEAGEFLVALGNALSDKKITSDELKDIIFHARLVMNIWQKTPSQYTVK